MPEIVGQGQIPCEAIGEGVIEVQHLQQPVPLNNMYITICEATHVTCRLAYSALLPKSVTKDITFTCKGKLILKQYTYDYLEK